MSVTVYRRGKPFMPPQWKGEGGALLLRPLPQALMAALSEHGGETKTIQAAQEADRVIKACLAGWIDVVDEDGQAVAFDPNAIDEMVDLLDGDVRLATFFEILQRSGLTSIDIKNFESASSSPALTGSKDTPASDADSQDKREPTTKDVTVAP